MRRQVFENLGDMAHSVELDHEVQLARSELYKLAKYAIKLHNMMKDADPEQGLEGWVQADISKSAEAISKVYHSLEYEMKVSNNTSDLGSSHGGGEPEGALPFESVSRRRRNTYKESLGRRLQKKTVNEAAPKIGDIRTFKTKDGIRKSKYVKKLFGRGGQWKPYWDDETGPDPAMEIYAQAVAQEMLKMAEKDPSIQLQNKAELKTIANQATAKVAKDKGVPKAEMPKINNATVKDLEKRVVSAQKGGAQQSQANAPAPPPAPQGGAAAPEEPQGGGGLDWAAMAARKDSRTQRQQQSGGTTPGAPAYPDPSDTRNQDANIQAPPPPKRYSDSAPKFPNSGGANTASPVQQQQGGGQAPTGLKTAPLTQGVRVSKSAAKILYNRKAYNFAGQGAAAPGVGEVISVPWKALGMTPPPGKENVGATVELAHGRMFLTKQAPGPAAPQAPAPQAPAGVDPGLAAAAANPANASKTAANLPGPEAPGTVDHGFQQALNKAGLQPAAQQNVAQAPPAQLPGMNQNAQPAAQTVSAQQANPNALTPGVRTSGKMVKYNGTVFTFAGQGKPAPANGQTIVVDPSAVGQRGKFKGQGVPVVLDPVNKQFFIKGNGQTAPQTKVAAKTNAGPEFGPQPAPTGYVPPATNDQANYFQKQRTGGAVPKRATSQQKNYFQQQRSGGRGKVPSKTAAANYFQKQRTGG